VEGENFTFTFTITKATSATTVTMVTTCTTVVCYGYANAPEMFRPADISYLVEHTDLPYQNSETTQLYGS
jgi:hypothetical protein